MSPGGSADCAIGGDLVVSASSTRSIMYASSLDSSISLGCGTKAVGSVMTDKFARPSVFALSRADTSKFLMTMNATGVPNFSILAASRAVFAVHDPQSPTKAITPSEKSDISARSRSLSDCGVENGTIHALN